jgi:hypothetical protein
MRVMCVRETKKKGPGRKATQRDAVVVVEEEDRAGWMCVGVRVDDSDAERNEDADEDEEEDGREEILVVVEDVERVRWG